MATVLDLTDPGIERKDFRVDCDVFNNYTKRLVKLELVIELKTSVFAFLKCIADYVIVLFSVCVFGKKALELSVLHVEYQTF